MLLSSSLCFSWLIFCTFAFDDFLPLSFPNVTTPSSNKNGTYPESLQSNFKLAFSNRYGEYADAQLNQTLHSFTVSLWLWGTESASLSIFTYGNSTRYGVALLRKNYSYYVGINGRYHNCSSYSLLSSSPSHLLVTWNSGWGNVSVYKDGYQVCMAYLQEGGVIERGGEFRIGGNYRFRGEIAYLNVYNTFTNTTEDVRSYRRRSFSDPSAIIPWNAFLLNTHGTVRILPEYEIFKNTFTRLKCHPTGMELILLRVGFSFLDPKELVLLNDACRPTLVNSTHVIFFANLSDCGTEVINYRLTSVLYHNEVRLRGSPSRVVRQADAINRTRVEGKLRSISFDCWYYMTTVHQPIYAPHITSFHKGGKTGSTNGYKITLYHNSNFSHAFTEQEYPINVEMEREVFVEVALLRREQSPDIWINRCRATPSADYWDPVRYDLIEDGCPNATDDHIQYYNTTRLGVRRFSFQTFRFNDYPSAVVFLHCQIQFCDPADAYSRCRRGLTLC